MDEKQQISAFTEDLNKLIDRYRFEFGISYASIIGVLYIVGQLLCEEACEEDSEN